MLSMLLYAYQIKDLLPSSSSTMVTLDEDAKWKIKAQVGSESSNILSLKVSSCSVVLSFVIGIVKVAAVDPAEKVTLYVPES